MDTGADKAQALQDILKGGGRQLVHGELEKLDGLDARPRRQRRHVGNLDSRNLAQFVQHEEERALPIDRNATRRAGAKAVTEDLEREQPVEPGCLQCGHKRLDREIALRTPFSAHWIGRR